MNSTDVTAADASRAEIGVVCALPLEIGPFLARCRRVRTYSGGPFRFTGGMLRDARIVIVESGPGPERARRATRALIDAHQPRWIVSTGFAGALRTELKLGHLIVANEVTGPEGPSLRIDLQMQADPARGLHVGRTLTMPTIVRTVQEKSELASRTGALAVDMESLAVASVCRDLQLRCLVIRAISDDLSADLPAEALSLMGETGAVRLGAVFGSLWKRPSSIKDLWRLRDQALKAADHLGTFLEGALWQLHQAEAVP